MLTTPAELSTVEANPLMTSIAPYLADSSLASLTELSKVKLKTALHDFFLAGEDKVDLLLVPVLAVDDFYFLTGLLQLVLTRFFLLSQELFVLLDLLILFGQCVLERLNTVMQRRELSEKLLLAALAGDLDEIALGEVRVVHPVTLAVDLAARAFHFKCGACNFEVAYHVSQCKKLRRETKNTLVEALIDVVISRNHD